MPHTTPPPASSLPSSRTLLRSTLLAATVAALLLVAVVLPAEYGVDPTGAGRLLGLTEMGEIKRALAAEAAVDASAETDLDAEAAAQLAAAQQTAAPDSAGSADVMRVTLRPGASAEVKLTMRQGARATYAWATDRGAVTYDAHTNASGSYHSYGKSARAWADQGTLSATADGRHGWYWRNPTDSTLTVTLQTQGDYLGVTRFD